MGFRLMTKLKDKYFDKDWYLKFVEGITDNMRITEPVHEYYDEYYEMELPPFMNNGDTIDMEYSLMSNYCGNFVILNKESLKLKHPIRLLPIIIDLIAVFNFLQEYENCETYDDTDELMDEIFILGQHKLTPEIIRSFYNKNWYMGGFFGEYIEEFMNGYSVKGIFSSCVQDLEWALSYLYGDNIDFDEIYVSTDIAETIYKNIHPYNLMHENLTFTQKDYEIKDINEERTESLSFD